MKGLVLNNIYLVINNIKVCILINILAIIGYSIYPIDLALFLMIFSTLILVPFATLSTITVSKSCKWNYLEDYMPINKKRVVISRYVTFFLMSIITLCVISVISLLYFVIGDNILERVIRIPSLRSATGWEIIKIYFFQTQLIAIFHFPLIYLLKQDKSDVVTLISIGISLIGALLIKSWNIGMIIIVVIVLYIGSIEFSCIFETRKNH